MPKKIIQPLSREDTERIQRNWTYLKSELVQPEIRDHFIDEAIWDIPDLEKIDAEKTPEEKNEMFLRLLLKSGLRAYGVFIEALQEIGSTHIIERLQNTPIEQKASENESLSREDTQRIRKNWDFLKEQLVQEEMCDHFIDEGIWDIAHLDKIKAEKTPMEKNDMFLQLLIKSGHTAYGVFIEVLQKKQSIHIIEQLKKTQITPEYPESPINTSIPPGEKKSSEEFVAAIDLGTAYSGYAFSSKEDYNADPLNISTSPYNEKTLSHKIPTSILFDAKKKFIAFGDEAEKKYSEQKEKECYFFHKFKMLLCQLDNKKNKSLTKQTTLTDIDGKEMPAIDVFSAGINYLMDSLINELTRKCINLRKVNIRWVLTVPGIWNDPAKQFMRDAAEKAGIRGKDLTIASEPEVASVFCKNIPIAKFKVFGEMRFHDFEPGIEYLIIDAGGGTVDSTIHRILDRGQIKEVAMASGGAWGGTYVDRKFHEMFENIVGEKKFNAYKSEYPADYFTICKNLEIGKRNFSTTSRYFVCKIPLSLDHVCNCKFEDLILKSSFKDHVNYKDHKLYLDVLLMKDLFSYVCNGIMTHVKTLLTETETQTILMVGGFSESPYLQETMKIAFPDHEIMIPNDAWLSVLKGAVLCGHNPKAIYSRIAKRSYGIDSLVPFESGIHPPKRLKVVNGIKYCSGVFSRHVTMHEELSADIKHCNKTYYPVHQNHETTRFDLYTSTMENPEYVDADQCSRLASVKVKCKAETASLKFRVTHVESELNVEILDGRTGENIDANLDYFETSQESGESSDVRLEKNE